jgi:lysyl-tRNA synthetase class 2
MSEENFILKQRREKAEELEGLGVKLYPSGVSPPEKTIKIINDYSHMDDVGLKDMQKTFRVAGRIMALRRFGKAAFLHIQDESGRLQLYAARDVLGAGSYDVFKKFDIGDIIEARGRIFRTKTGELTLEAEYIGLVTKSMRTLPEKFHGLKDKELRYRRRYLDLVMNDEARTVFLKRSRIIQSIRDYFTSYGFLEVETPMMQPIVGGATARPFRTHHNALGMDLYLRIAPELYLKRLLVGGLERVFELNRNFRNEGISIQHNPEFTMLEFYEAYATFEDLMKRTEELFARLAKEICGNTALTYQGREINLAHPWKRLRFLDSLQEIGGLDKEDIADRAKVVKRLNALDVPIKGDELHGKLLAKLFDLLVEPRLQNPTFITHYPTDISPLARRNEADPLVTDRFELFIAGREIANAFTELNDPGEQLQRFEEQIAKRGDDEEIPPELDEDYIHALEIGMPPAAGEGIGIDRLVMLFTDSPSIRDVILFPQLRSESL